MVKVHARGMSNFLADPFDQAEPMKFAVQLKGSKPLFENVAPCFQGGFARIKKSGDDWFLESSAFDDCTTGSEVFPIADKLLRLDDQEGQPSQGRPEPRRIRGFWRQGACQDIGHQGEGDKGTAARR